MPKKPEPLKEKWGRAHYFRQLGGKCYKSTAIVFLEEDVKSAVQGLLEEIKQRKEELLDIDRETCTNEAWAEVNGEINALEFSEKLIKKWFADVIDD